MKPYTNKTDRIDPRKCLYSEIKKGKRAAKKAIRRVLKKLNYGLNSTTTTNP